MSKRINKKVAVVGSLVFLLLVAAAIVIIMNLGQEADKFIKDGDSALSTEDYDKAERNYLKAHKFAKTGALRKEILFKLAEIYIQTGQWPKTRGCWEEIISIDSENIEARLGRLKYIYIVADSYTGIGRNVSSTWEEVRSQATELIDVVERAGLLTKDRAKWEPLFGVEENQLQLTTSRCIGAYLYLLRGRAAFELAKMGAVTAPDELLVSSIADLEKVREFDPNNVDAYWYRAQAAIEKGVILASRGNLEEREKAARKAGELLQQAVQLAGNSPKAYINVLTHKLMLARKSSPQLMKQQIKLLEPEYMSLVNRFPSNAEVFATLSGYYSIYSIYSEHQAGLANLDKAIEAAEKAVELDKNNVTYAINAANLFYRRSSVYGQESGIPKAIEIAKKAVEFPEARDTLGPRSFANKTNRFVLFSFLANCYIEQILEPYDEESRIEVPMIHLEQAEKVVHEIEQIFGSAEEPQVVKWQGMLELAKGNTDIAMRKLYAAYEQIKVSSASEYRDAQLSYTLAKIYLNTSEVGAAMEFLTGAIEAGIEMIKPAAILDYLEVLGEVDMWSYALSSANPYNIDAFEQKFGPSQRSRTLRIKALIGINRVTEAEEELAKLDQNSLDAVKLNLVLVQAKIRQIKAAIAKSLGTEDNPIVSKPAGEEQRNVVSDAAVKLMTNELNKYRQLQTDLVQKLLIIDPNSIEETSVSAVCGNFVAQGQTDRARDLVDRFLKYFPNSTSLLFYKQLLSEPDPGNISRERHKELEKQALMSITNPLDRAVKLGIFYRRENDLKKAVDVLREALEMKSQKDEKVDFVQGLGSRVQGPGFRFPDPRSQRPGRRTTRDELRRVAATHLFEIACQMENWKLAGDVIDISKRENLDGCQGQLFAARFDMAKRNYKDAMAKIDECLKQKPIFSHAYLLRSNINAELGNERASIEDISKAASLNPLDGDIARSMAATLYLRNRKLGDNVSSEQAIEVKRALERAIWLNPDDVVLLSDYAEYISTTEPAKALAIRQTMQKNSPNLQNAILLAKLATTMALKETNSQQKDSLLEIAVSSLEQAKKIDPHDRLMLEGYAEYYRATGQQEKAKQLLLESQDEKLLWRHYFQLGQFEDAKKVLLQLYKQRPKDVDVVKGLFLVARRIGDNEAVRKYSEELLAIEDTAENRLEQISAYLSVGLVDEAERKLQSFKERHSDEPGVLLLEGWLAMKQGQLKKAMELTNQNLAVNEGNAVAWRLRGEINLLMANYSQAIIDFKKSKSISAAPATRIALAKAYLQADQTDNAITELRNIIGEKNAPLEVRILLEQIYKGLGRKDSLKIFYDENLEKFPANLLWYVRAADFAIANGEFDRAEQLYKKAYVLKQQSYAGQSTENIIQDIEYVTVFDGYLHSLIAASGETGAANRVLRPDKLQQVIEEGQKYEHTALAPLALYWIGEAKLKLGDRNTAIEYFQKAIDKAELNENLVPDFLQRICTILGADEVLTFCEQRLKTNPDSPAANFTMFYLAKIMGRYDKAYDYISKCIELIGQDTPRGFDYLLYRADFLTAAYEKTSDNSYLKKGISDYESLLDKKPNNSNILNNLAYMLAENQQRLPEALQYAKRAFEQMPGNPNFMDTYAYILYKNGEVSRAADLLTAALQQYRQESVATPVVVWEHLGVVREKLGEKAQAIDAYNRALQAGADKLPQVVQDRIKSAIERLSK